MKHRIILSALLVIIITAGLNTNANADPWRHGYCRPVVRYCPPVRVYVPPVAVGYYGQGYCAPRYYHEHEYRGYRHGYRR